MPRTTKDEAGSTTQLWKHRAWIISTGEVYYNNTENRNASNYRLIRSTVNTPGFRSGTLEELPMNPFYFLETRNRITSGYWHSLHEGLNIGQDHAGPMGPFDASLESMTQADYDTVDRNAVNASLLKLKDMRVNLGNALAERKQTGGMILRTASRLGGALRALKKGDYKSALNSLGNTAGQTFRRAVRSTNFRGVPRSLRTSDLDSNILIQRGLYALALSKGQKVSVKRRKQMSNFVQGKTSKISSVLADDWLALQFGWKPLINDVYDAAESLAKLHNEPRRFRVSYSKTKRSFKTTKLSYNYVPVIRRERIQYTRKYVYVFSYQNEVIADLAKFGVTNPASVIWELTPWSFVVDWFIPVGQFIDTWDATIGYTFEKGCTTSFRKSSIQFRSSNGTYEQDGYREWAKLSGRSDEVLCERAVLNDFPHATLPSFDPKLTFNKGVTFLALLRQRF